MQLASQHAWKLARYLKLMRDIKFRAWDTFRKKMGKVTSLEFSEGLRGGLIVMADFNGDKLGAIQDDFLLMQYTGLLDKNGKEIYEGDILRIKYGEEKPYLFQVTWDEEQLRFPIPGIMSSRFDISRQEVVGNIYENPELLQ